ncbi:uncharacterized protein PHALS_04288 [Plasmopara halstedii]|uniref:Uncharacterized protein n=1 Tax=Plasmopara halstedii TaxID=4781 RepID=A0A0P1B1I3_PLAHL|nr:uncharacterized protein PHALS_04288 [Plasmopara halstedii]CEG47413.1 hypothetical protein PHALS_04288 [Plasmopara halstedii]|eukprot:XP_024583782.1 hypothetical protein PHALS_04288 [Plasmopara halstedii]
MREQRIRGCIDTIRTRSEHAQLFFDVIAAHNRKCRYHYEVKYTSKPFFNDFGEVNKFKPKSL